MIGVTVPLSGLSNHHSTTTPAQRRSQSDATGSREDKLTTLDHVNEGYVLFLVALAGDG
jgi:hypothetical protein